MTEHKTRILVVDDDESIGEVLKAGLAGHGFAVRCETCSDNALKTCLEFRPALVLLDVDMPGKDGGQVAAELRDDPALQRIPVMFLTSLAGRRDMLKPAAAGEILLSKAISIAELVARIRACLLRQ